MRRTAKPYRAALQWLVEYDDCDWLDHESRYLSVSASLVADLYGRTDEELTGDLHRAREARP